MANEIIVTPHNLITLANAGVECIQGYYYDKPLELDTFYRKYVK